MANGPIDLAPVMARINDAFTARNRLYRYTKLGFDARLEELNKRMNALIANHVKLPISQQVSLEAQWLIHYTDDWERAAAALERLEVSLTSRNQLLEQQPDGSWGPGCTEFYRKLEPTVDALLSTDVLGDASNKRKALLPLTFMQELQDPAIMIGRLERLRVSRIRETGRNNRDEFGSMITSLTQLFFKKVALKAFNLHPEAGFTVSPQSCTALRDYLWRVQGTRTGYWGPTYDFDGEIIDVQDLSYTFHVIKYYDDAGPDGFNRTDLPNVARILETTKIIEEYQYPNGLRPDALEDGTAPRFSDHNNYDLVTTLQLMWPALSAEERVQASAKIAELLDWCLTTSLSLQTYSFAPSKDMSTVNSYNYGVRFLSVVGFWSKAPPFWKSNGSWPPSGTDPRDLATHLLGAFRAFDDGSEPAKAVLKILNKALSDLAPVTA